MARSQDISPLSGFYYFVFAILEPLSTFAAAVVGWTNAAQFSHDLIPSTATPALLDSRGTLAVWQLSSCFFLFSTISFSFIRGVLNNVSDVTAQECLIRNLLICLAIGDVIHVTVTALALSPAILQDPSSWNSVTHGNITFTIWLLAARLGWIAGVGRASASDVISPKKISGNRKRT